MSPEKPSLKAIDRRCRRSTIAVATARKGITALCAVPPKGLWTFIEELDTRTPLACFDRRLTQQVAQARLLVVKVRKEKTSLLVRGFSNSSSDWLGVWLVRRSCGET
jgi:hypothetical protein